MISLFRFLWQRRKQRLSRGVGDFDRAHFTSLSTPPSRVSLLERSLRRSIQAAQGVVETCMNADKRSPDSG